ncbi:SAM hydrolase/SAM-dependent halogenase family protein [Roseofilum casamattae]|uniref:SAM-dependent chlorinase/fluorinase n=1 Tax=Roseofilum casamattae BLCC-M143 TaxID=3022442 RepID=A0ABT7BY04_9CYAN|nr:SAM-dependent chlorinase/fluorinase [Roseofilum casamattae]MDJ1184077.1 SAM-dependent chlorinase/fluorinase [Roseofilum casamattae BLCC-M143]
MEGSRLVTLLSDFGLKDPYVGVMKGAIANINPELNVIDITHDLPSQNLIAAQFALGNAYPYFPDGTVHVAVVDPGVGTQRRAIALQFPRGYLVGPDNGIFNCIVAQSPTIAAVELTNPRYWRSPNLSTTFHGRDIFAPIGAHLASGIPLDELGDPIDPETLVSLPIPSYTKREKYLEGTIQYIDRFGNLITTIPGSEVTGKQWSVRLDGRAIAVGSTYNDTNPGEAIALVASHGWVELAVNCGSAERELNLTWGDPIQLAIE